MDDSHEEQVCMLIQPNRSLSPKGIILFLGAFIVLVVTIVLGFALAGAWLILPFAGLEIVLIAAMCRWMYHHHTDQEVVLLQGDKLTIVQRQAGHERRHEFQRYWTHVRVESGGHAWYPSRLMIGSHGNFVELGADVTETARKKLAYDLQGLLDRKQ